MVNFKRKKARYKDKERWGIPKRVKLSWVKFATPERPRPTGIKRYECKRGKGKHKFKKVEEERFISEDFSLIYHIHKCTACGKKKFIKIEKA